ncbi:hypothetical protein Tco_0562596 [Tanacetum coccineum]
MQQPLPNNNFIPQPSFNQNYMQQPMPNPEDITEPTTAMNLALVLMAKTFKLNYSTPTNNNQKISSNPRNRQIAQPRIANLNANQIGNGNVIAARAKGNANGNNGIQVQAKEFDFMAAVGDLEEIEEMDQLSFSCGTKEGTVEQHPTTIEETHAYFETLYNNLAIEVGKVNSVNRKMKETNADLINELARYKNQEKCFEINQEKYDKLERCYQKSVYQEQCLIKKINALHLSSAKIIMTLNEEITNLNNQLSKEKSNVSYLRQEKKILKSDFKTREDELLNKQIQLENKIKELDKILLRSQLFDKVPKQKDTTKGMSANTKFANQSTVGKPLLQHLRNHSVVRQPNAFQSGRPKFSKTWVPPKVAETNNLSNPVTSHLTSREDKFVPINKVRASVRTNPITVSQPHVITKKDVNSDSNGLSATGVDNTAMTKSHNLGEI